MMPFCLEIVFSVAESLHQALTRICAYDTLGATERRDRMRRTVAIVIAMMLVMGSAHAESEIDDEQGVTPPWNAPGVEPPPLNDDGYKALPPAHFPPPRRYEPYEYDAPPSSKIRHGRGHKHDVRRVINKIRRILDVVEDFTR